MDDSFISGLSIDEIRWLDVSIDADAGSEAFPVIVSKDGPFKSRPVDIPSPRSSQLLSASDAGRFGHKVPLHLKCVLTPPTPVPTPPPDMATRIKSRFSRPTSSISLHPVSASAPSTLSSPLSALVAKPKPVHSAEWIHRRPRSPRVRSPHSPFGSSQPNPGRPRSQTHSHFRATSEEQWPLTVRPRSRAERVVPALKSRPAGMRSESLSSVSSSITTTATSSSRPDTPVSPGSKSSHPSKSILTRTSSIATKNSSTSTNCNKSVKFVDMPTVHYASAGYWDMEGIDVNSMDMGPDGDHSGMGMGSREALCSPPAAVKHRAKGLARFLHRRSSQLKAKPTISGPFALGSVRPHPSPPFPSLAKDDDSIQSTSSSASIPASSHSGSTFRLLPISEPFPLRCAPSLESFRSVKSTGGRSTRSLGSVRSTGSTGKFRSWLGRMGLSLRTEMGCGIS